MKIVVIDYKRGNVRSVLYALERLGYSGVLSADPDEIAAADRVIFPGVGAAGKAMEHLRQSGLDEVIRSLSQPVLGICLGMQLLCEYSEENDTDCLGIIPGKVQLFQSTNGEKVPHMGWNSIQLKDGGWVSDSLQDAFVYFVHSYYVPSGPFTVAETNYTLPYSAVLRKDNFFATQFHPEKSGSVGEQILKDFLTQKLV